MNNLRPIDILMLTNWDWANTGWRFWRALKTMPSPRPLNILIYKGKPHAFNYPEQAPTHWNLRDRSFKIDRQGQQCRWPIIIPCPELRPLVERARCVYFLAETFIETGADLSRKFCVMQMAGATMREEPEKVSAFFNSIVHRTIAQFPSLMNLGAKNEVLVYYPVDTDFIKPVYEQSVPGKILIGHWPSNPENKGTALILSVIDRLKKDPSLGDKFEYVGSRDAHLNETSHLDWTDNLDRMSKVDVYIETIQMEILGKPFGEWGNTAIEGAALGKIVITNSLSTDLYGTEYGHQGLWIANDAEQLETHLRNILSMNPASLFVEKVKMREWVEKHHSIPATGQRLWQKVFKDVFSD